MPPGTAIWDLPPHALGVEATPKRRTSFRTRGLVVSGLVSRLRVFIVASKRAILIAAARTKLVPVSIHGDGGSYLAVVGCPHHCVIPLSLDITPATLGRIYF
jgi:hypothetical protein